MVLRYRQFLEGYNPNEPRVSRGSPHGGEWTDNPLKPVFGKSKKKNILEALRLIRQCGFEAEEWKKPGSGIIAIRSNTDGKIYVNTSNKFWSNPEENQKRYFDTKALSSDNPAHTLYHEMGHGLYDPSDNWFVLAHQDTAREEVSKYAAMNPKEFVSEVYAGLRGGRKFSDHVMKMFEMYAKERKD